MNLPPTSATVLCCQWLERRILLHAIVICRFDAVRREKSILRVTDSVDSWQGDGIASNNYQGRLRGASKLMRHNMSKIGLRSVVFNRFSDIYLSLNLPSPSH